MSRDQEEVQMVRAGAGCVLGGLLRGTTWYKKRRAGIFEKGTLRENGGRNVSGKRRRKDFVRGRALKSWILVGFCEGARRK